MTGFGRGEASGSAQKILVEIKAVNHRYGEAAVRLPRVYAALEERVRRHVLNTVYRGRTEVFIKIEDVLGTDRRIRVNKEVALAYYGAMRELAAELGISADIQAFQLVQLPEVVVTEEPQTDIEAVWDLCRAALDEALRELTAMREAEGAKLEADFMGKLEWLKRQTQALTDQAPRLAAAYYENLLGRLRDLAGEIPLDESRLAMEAALTADRCCVDEELVRLDSHIRQFHEILGEGKPVGRKLDFLLQEMNREVNTIGSKVDDLEMSRVVIDMKSELEKIREQAQNVE
jgi:uncharacterized protein (TIGR00255 family)